ncbi:MAG TPA: TMEM175 family protein [Mycobacterium sp.]|uniref:TMEM175 family protein n=1 Tax=Mycolicibacterium sp. TaxID=2320850 RepID=UPI0025FCC90F|nr:TMEM175 family protein [Mycolicibacterium sp.]HPX37241.1 TMEM175 family protein [Mycobacterium sp.]HQC77479.1 TMEM175 family protein [Mycobacterium sp.]
MKRWVFSKESVEFGRAVNLIDAIFGFSLTLLVTSLDVPPAAAWVSLSALMDTGLGEQLLAFVISFVVVVGFWLANHQVLASFQALDGATVRVCIYLVGLVIFIPFATKAISDPDPANHPLPTALYAGNVAAITLVTVALILVGRARGLADRKPPVPGLIAHSLVVAAVFLISVPIAYRFGPDTAKWSWLSLVVLNPLLDFAVKRFAR